MERSTGKESGDKGCGCCFAQRAKAGIVSLHCPDNCPCILCGPLLLLTPTDYVNPLTTGRP